MANHQKRSILVALVCAIAALSGTFIGYIMFGALTGVIGSCSSAPDWWAKVYLCGFALLPAAVVWAAIRGRRRYLRRYEKKTI